MSSLIWAYSKPHHWIIFLIRCWWWVLTTRFKGKYHASAGHPCPIFCNHRSWTFSSNDSSRPILDSLSFLSSDRLRVYPGVALKWFTAFSQGHFLGNLKKTSWNLVRHAGEKLTWFEMPRNIEWVSTNLKHLYLQVSTPPSWILVVHPRWSNPVQDNWSMDDLFHNIPLYTA